VPRVLRFLVALSLSLSLSLCLLCTSERTDSLRIVGQIPLLKGTRATTAPWKSGENASLVVALSPPPLVGALQVRILSRFFWPLSLKSALQKLRQKCLFCCTLGILCSHLHTHLPHTTPSLCHTYLHTCVCTHTCTRAFLHAYTLTLHSLYTRFTLTLHTHTRTHSALH
jgi:hypothetical protein